MTLPTPTWQDHERSLISEFNSAQTQLQPDIFNNTLKNTEMLKQYFGLHLPVSDSEIHSCHTMTDDSGANYFFLDSFYKSWAKMHTDNWALCIFVKKERKNERKNERKRKRFFGKLWPHKLSWTFYDSALQLSFITMQHYALLS